MSKVASLKLLQSLRKFKMKIADFKRDEANQVIAVGEDGAEMILASEYIAANKPQIGDEYTPVETVAEIAAIVEAVPEATKAFN